ncbi:MAG: aminoacyl-tRNA hydrolase [Solirubrobacteraceae bacterium]
MKRLFGDGGGAIDWLLVGLGNPGAEYARSRHNIGFMVAGKLVERWQLNSAKKLRFNSRIADGSVRIGADSSRQRVAVMLPQTFYNDAGRAVGPARGSYRVALERVLVVHDEIDLPFGEIRGRVGGGLAGNNGLKSIKTALGGDGFTRMRIGVGRPDSTDPEIVAAWVLGRFRETQAEVDALVEQAADRVEALLGES